MNKPNPMKGKGHHNKVQTTSITKPDGKKKDDDSSFIYNLGILIGCVAEIETKGGRKFEGVLSAFTNQALKIMIEAAHEPTGDDESSITKHYDLLIVPADEVSVIKFRNAELSYATRDFQTDAVIGATRQLSVGDKELTPWEGAEEGQTLELDTTTNGWEATEMFKENEAKYGVKSSFKEDLSGYTTQIDKSDAAKFKNDEERAAQVAQEIENSGASWERTKVENGDDEEAEFSAVCRPSRNNSNHSNNNTTQNNSSGGSEKYIPPHAKRQQNVQQKGNIPTAGQGHLVNNNAVPMSNNGNNRKPVYAGPGQRNNFNPGPNNYHHDRRGGGGYEHRSGPPRVQYSHTAGHGDARGRMDDGIRQPRMSNKGSMDRDRRGGGGREDKYNNLKEFKDKFQLTNHGDSVSSRMRMTSNQPPQHSGPPLNVHMNASSVGSSNAGVSNPQNIRNASPPNSNAVQISTQSPVKPKKEEFSPVPPLVQPSGPASTNSENSSGSGSTSPHSTSKQGNASSASPSPNSSSSVNQPPNEVTPTTPGSGEGQPPPTVANSDSKGSSSEAESKNKKTTFTFNPNAKEFNPTAKPFTPQRSPSTPPRPPSTPASTPQLMPAPAHSLMPLPMPHQIQLYAPPYTTHAQAGLTPSSNSSASSGGNTPRHRSHNKGGMIGGPSRPDVTPQMQMPTGPPLLPSIHTAAPTASFAYLHPQSGQYAQMVGVVPQGMVPLYQPDGSGGGQMHYPMHNIHNGATPPTNAGHQQAATPQSNPNAPTSNVPTNGHAFGQGGANHGPPHHMHYAQCISIAPAMVRVPYAPGPPTTHMFTLPTVVHQGGGNSGIPHSQ